MATAKQLTPKQEDRRHRILEATRAMVAEQGYDGMVMSNVADRAGVSPTTLYNLYNTKDELVLEALRELLMDHYASVEAMNDGPGWRYLLSVVSNGATLANSEPEYAEAITSTLFSIASSKALNELLIDNIRDDVHASLKAMSERGQIRPGTNLKKLAMLIVADYWAVFVMKGKRFIEREDLDFNVKINLLSVLAPVTTKPTRQEMFDLIDQEYAGQVET